MAQLALISTLKGHQEKVWDVSWNPKGNLLASCGSDKTVRIWNEGGGTWMCSAILEGAHQRTVRSVAWSPCGSYLASASFDATTSIWDNKAGQFECAVTLEGHENEVKSVAWAVSGQVLATCSRDKSVWIWQVDEEDQDYECASVLSEHTQDVKCVIWHPRKDLLASCSYDDTIKMFKEEADDWTCCATLESHTSTVWGICFDKTGQRLASCSADKTVKIWKEYLPGNQQGIQTASRDSTWKCVCTLSGYHTRDIYDIAWCHVTGLIATACGDDSVRIFQETPDSDPDQPSFSLVTTVTKAHSNDVNAVCWNPQVPGLLATASDDGLVKLWKFTDS